MKHGDDAVEGACRVDVDRRDRAAGDVAADEGHVEHARHDDVVDVRAPPGEEAGVLAPRDTLADEPRCRRGRRAHWRTSAPPGGRR